MASIIAFADDLSGAAETAAVLGVPGLHNPRASAPSAFVTPGAPSVTIELAGDDAPLFTPPDADIIVVDTDTRSLAADHAERRMRDVATRAASDHPDARIVKKIDSLLRGHLAAELTPLVTPGGIVLCPALPVMRRVVTGGVAHVDGAPLESHDAWRMQRTPAPTSVTDAIAPLPASVIELGTVRAEPDALASAIDAAIASGYVAVCDAETDDDIDRIVAATWGRAGVPAVLAGSSAVAAAAAQWMRSHESGGHVPNTEPGNAARPNAHATSDTVVDGVSAAADRPDQSDRSDRPGRPGRPLIVVAGSAEPGIQHQLARIAEHGVEVLSVAPFELHDAPAVLAERLARLAASATACAVTVSGPVNPADATALSRSLAAVVADATGDADLVLTGGETARRVLDAMQIASLSLGEPIMRRNGEDHAHEYGAVRSTAPDGRSVVTRPGSFGDADSLLTIIRALRPGEYVPRGEPRTDRKVTP